MFPPERAIRHRPAAVAGRRAFGHWEGDLTIVRSEHQGANVASLVERKTRFAVLLRNPGRRSRPLMHRLVTLPAPLPRAARRPITFDRGLALVSWRDPDAGMGMKAWSCDPQAPWSEGRFRMPRPGLSLQGNALGGAALVTSPYKPSAG